MDEQLTTQDAQLEKIVGLLEDIVAELTPAEEEE